MYELNKCYKKYITNREGILANLSSSGLTLKFLWKNPDENILKSISNPPFFQLYFKKEVMFLLLKFENLKWVDIPCIFRGNTKHIFHFEEENLPCNIMLFNSNTGKLFLNYTCKMPKGVTKAFVQGVHLQKDIPEKAVTELINNIRSSYSAVEMSRLSLGKAK